MVITHDCGVAGAAAMIAANPRLRFCFVSGRSADPTEKASQDQLARCLLGVAKAGGGSRLLDNRAIVVWPAWTPP